MGVVLIVGTAKGTALLRAEASRDRWTVEALALKGWIVTAATRDPTGRYYVGVTSDVYGSAIVVSDDLETWQQLENGPRYAPSDVGNEEHNRIIGATDPFGRYKGTGRHVDQIWKLHAAGDWIYAGVSEAGLFRSNDRGKSWEVVRGLDAHPDRADWGPGSAGCVPTPCSPTRAMGTGSGSGSRPPECSGRTMVARPGRARTTASGRARDSACTRSPTIRTART